MKKIIVFISFVLVLIITVFIFYLLIEKKEQDSFYKENWGYHYLNIDTLHNNYGLTGKNVKVALIDTGLSIKITDINVVEGINIIENSQDYTDDHGHGTHIAGLLASKEFGVAPEIDLYVAKALDKKLSGDMDSILKALEWSISKNVDIILMPFGTFKHSEELERLIDEAVLDKDILVVSSVGNYGLQEDIDIMYPAKYENVIAVGALDKEKGIWKGTTLGEELDYLLPGQYINSYSLTGDNLVSSGTSMSSAYMAGILALYVEKNRDKENNFNILMEKKGEYSKIQEYNILDPVKMLK
ncbi:S8 family serine peptidase [Metabacillus halosaccharovorans]|uniref:S8 family serine peptidase n=1 Tax=Metabacillus halosaccharovorans TaxID=930124 RepID=UPI001C2000AD|nr:S8 family serine peptidase [Metabacillus halosaccharovorans]MBU7592796.1 S8 family serine peptidase [Metabacillus halosaccharovorans]